MARTRPGAPWRTAFKFSSVQKLSTALRFAVSRRYLEYNPCDTVTRPNPGPSRKKAAPRVETIARLLHQIETERWGAAAIIAVTAGLRKDEVLALRWEDIEWSVAGFPDFWGGDYRAPGTASPRSWSAGARGCQKRRF